MNIKHAVILAGGLGTRLRSVVSDVPKPLAKINKTPFIVLLIKFWKSHGIKTFYLSIGYKYQKFSKILNDYELNVDIRYISENRPLGTGGGLLNVLKYIPDDTPFLVMNGDTYFPVSLNEISKFHSLKNSELTIALTKKNDTMRYQKICVNDDMRIISDRTFNQSDDSFYVNAGLYLISNKNYFSNYKFKQNIKISFEEKFIKDLIDKKSIYGFYSKEFFIDIGLPNDYKRAQTLLTNIY